MNGPQVQGEGDLTYRIDIELALSSPQRNKWFAAVCLRCGRAGMNDMHHGSFDAPEPVETAPAPSARRRLLRGAFAAPVALTLQSGSAFAAASATCVARQVANPVRSQSDIDKGLNVDWVRVRAWILDPAGDKNTSTWVWGEDVAAFAKPGRTVFISKTQWYAVFAESAARVVGSTGEEPVVVGTTLGSKPGSVGNGTVTSFAKESTSITVAIKVDANGNIIGMVGDSTGGSAVTGSCWSSFRP